MEPSNSATATVVQTIDDYARRIVAIHKSLDDCVSVRQEPR
jgi:hypothetical protein